MFWFYLHIIIRYIFRPVPDIYYRHLEFFFTFMGNSYYAIIWLSSFDISRIEILYIDTSRRHDSRERAAATVELRSNRSAFLQVLLFKRESCKRKKVMNYSRGCRAFVEIFHVSNIACYRCLIWTSLRRRFAWIDRTGIASVSAFFTLAYLRSAAKAQFMHVRLQVCACHHSVSSCADNTFVIIQ